MRRVKRMAVRVTPKAPSINWANGLEAGDVKLGSEDMPDGNMYLIEDSDDLELDLKQLLEPHDAAIFEEELLAPGGGGLAAAPGSGDVPGLV